MIDQRAVEFHQPVAHALILRADHDAVRVERIRHGRTLPQKLGIRTNPNQAVRVAPVPFEIGGLNHQPHPLAAADGHGRFVHNDRIALAEILPYLIRGGADKAQVGTAVGARRRADGDEDDLGLRHRVLITGEKTQVAAAEIEQFLQIGLVNGWLALFETLDLRFVLVHAGDVVAEIGESGACGQADITGS